MRARFPLGAGTGFPLGTSEQAAEASRAARFEHRHTHAAPVHAHSAPVHTHTGPSHSHAQQSVGGHTHEFGVNGTNTTTATGSTARVTTVGGQSYPYSGNGVTNTTGSGHDHGSTPDGTGATGSNAAANTGNNAAAETDQQGVGGQDGGIAFHPYLALNFIIKT